MELIFAILSGVASLFTAFFAWNSEVMFFSVLWLIACFILGCISIAKFHETAQEYGGSILYVIAQIFIIGIFITAVCMVFHLAGL
ncbi:MAG: hypothetical protein IJ996_04420 [Clostridia bacterium]|nr:hypothetical protein [Clostridia bacterium]